MLTSCHQAVKRILREYQEHNAEQNQEFIACPLEVFHSCFAHTLKNLTCSKDNLFEWHFTVRGPPDTEFESGLYHGRIILPPEYPFKPPSIMMLTVSTESRTTLPYLLILSSQMVASNWESKFASA